MFLRTGKLTACTARYYTKSAIHPWIPLLKIQNVIPDQHRIITFLVGNAACGNQEAIGTISHRNSHLIQFSEGLEIYFLR